MSRNATAPRELLRGHADLGIADAGVDESGQTMAEYALITALIALVVAAAVTSVGNPAIQALYAKLGDAIP